MTALPLQPDYGAKLTLDVNVTEVKLGENYSQRVIRGPNRHKQTWQLNWNGLSDGEEEILRSFFAALETDYFTWTPPGDGATEIKLVTDKYDATISGWNNWRVTLKCREVFDV
jgi:phage-related protein